MSPGPYSKIEERIRSQWKIQPQELLPANNPESFGKTLLEHLRQLALLPCDLPTARQLILAEINSRVTGARTFNGVHRHPFITTRDVQRALKTFIESTGGIAPSTVKSTRKRKRQQDHYDQIDPRLRGSSVAISPSLTIDDDHLDEDESYLEEWDNHPTTRNTREQTMEHGLAGRSPLTRIAHLHESRIKARLDESHDFAGVSHHSTTQPDDSFIDTIVLADPVQSSLPRPASPACGTSNKANIPRSPFTPSALTALLQQEQKESEMKLVTLEDTITKLEEEIGGLREARNYLRQMSADIGATLKQGNRTGSDNMDVAQRFTPVSTPVIGNGDRRGSRAVVNTPSSLSFTSKSTQSSGGGAAIVEAMSKAIMLFSERERDKQTLELDQQLYEKLDSRRRAEKALAKARGTVDEGRAYIARCQDEWPFGQ